MRNCPCLRNFVLIYFHCIINSAYYVPEKAPRLSALHILTHLIIKTIIYYYLPILQMRKLRHSQINMPKATLLVYQQTQDLNPGKSSLQRSYC